MGGERGGGGPGKAAEGDRAARLAAAMRANLRRRKEQRREREREGGAGPAADGAGPAAVEPPEGIT